MHKKAAIGIIAIFLLSIGSPLVEYGEEEKNTSEIFEDVTTHEKRSSSSNMAFNITGFQEGSVYSNQTVAFAGGAVCQIIDGEVWCDGVGMAYFTGYMFGNRSMVENWPDNPEFLGNVPDYDLLDEPYRIDMLPENRHVISIHRGNGGGSTCAVLDDGSLTCWGSGSQWIEKAQQDGFLPYVEDGTVTLIGATTENPSFEINAALLSRCQVFVLNRLSDAALDELLSRAEAIEGRSMPVDEEARHALRAMADGDGRYLLNLAEELFALDRDTPLDTAQLIETVQKRAPLYDKGQEGHYNLISALHKSLRGSDVDAALYWLARMLAGGEDPRFIARRLARAAVEDIGLADPQALPQALAAWEAYERIGSPEGELALAQCTIYLASAPKSNAAYSAFGAAMRAAKETGSLMPPKHILNAPTGLMKDLGYGAGYSYDHNAEDGFSGQDYFPEDIARQNFYQPVERGFEREISKRLEYWDKLRSQRRVEDSES